MGGGRTIIKGKEISVKGKKKNEEWEEEEQKLRKKRLVRNGKRSLRKT